MMTYRHDSEKIIITVGAALIALLITGAWSWSSLMSLALPKVGECYAVGAQTLKVTRLHTYGIEGIFLSPEGASRREYLSYKEIDKLKPEQVDCDRGYILEP
jgi:hypothetical protein